MESSSRNRELTAALRQQSAIDKVLRCITESAVDAGPALRAIVAQAARLGDCNGVAVMLEDGGRLRAAAHTRCTPEFAAFLENGESPGRGTTAGQAALERRSVQTLDFLDESGAIVTQSHRTEPVRTVLAVPMCWDGQLLGAVLAWRREVRAFTDRQVRLFETFASYGAIAVAGARLSVELQTRNRELAEVLEQRSAIGEILRAISESRSSAMPVFETIVRNAVALCGGLFANVFRFDGEMLHYVASHNTGPHYVELLRAKYPMRPDVSQVSGRVMLDKAVVWIEDAGTDPDYDQAFPPALGWRRMLGVPMLRDGEPLGAIVVGWAEAGPVSAATEALLKTFADQAVIAIENVRLFDQIQDKSCQLELANRYKSRFLAAASHDLRQPVHALNLFVGQLRTERDPAERDRLVARIDAAAGAIDELLNALLDMSRLEAGVLEAHPTEFPVERLLNRIETTFAAAARQKGLAFDMAPSRAWIRSDFILLERILLNLVSNAVRYTAGGRILIGCRRRGEHLRIDVRDTGPGIPEDQQQNIFREFYQLSDAQAPRRGRGLGLGLALVERLGRVLDHPIEVASAPGKGSRFSVTAPLAAGAHPAARGAALTAAICDPVAGKLIVVIDDDALVLDAMKGILRSWGCTVLAAESDAAALESLDSMGRPPDAIISDYRLGDGRTGFAAIEQVREATAQPIPAFLISGDTAPERVREARARGFQMLHKPVPLMTLRAMLIRVLRSADNPRPGVPLMKS